MGAVYGIAAGILAALPLVAALRLHERRVGAGLAAVLASLAVFHVAAFLMRRSDAGALVPFALSATVAFLAAVGLAARQT